MRFLRKSQTYPLYILIHLCYDCGFSELCQCVLRRNDFNAAYRKMEKIILSSNVFNVGNHFSPNVFNTSINSGRSLSIEESQSNLRINCFVVIKEFYNKRDFTYHMIIINSRTMWSSSVNSFLFSTTMNQPSKVRHTDIPMVLLT